MEIRVEAGDITRAAADAVVVNLFEGVKTPGGGTGAVDRALGGAISETIRLGDLTGKANEFVLLYTHGRIPAPRVVVAGLGKSSEFTIDSVRNLAGKLVRYLRRPGIETVATIAHGAGIAGLPPAACAQAIAEGALLGGYRFTRRKGAGTKEENAEGPKRLIIVEHDAAKVPEMQAAVERGRILAEAANFARDLANEPSNYATPTVIAERAQELARELGLECEILERADAERMGMGAFLAVARGSDEPPKVIRLAYRGKGGEGYDLALIGKGITFDTGGISLKPAQNMEAMKADMTGAAAVIAAIGAIARLKVKVDVLAIAPCTENMPGGHATKPGDVAVALDGKTIEIVNTDAEGRLVLADAICWARQLGARRIVDVATLTGAVSVALGDQCYGLLANDDELARKVEAAAQAAGERTWRLPMFKEYEEQLKSDVADIKNTGGRNAGTITGAKFIERFVEGTPWVHLDIAGVDMAEKDRGWIVKGASGQAVRPLVHLALQLAGEG
ncbi:Cytosol aminopeptidase [bacterium HR29]|nr:Cytosol aminopeptidase [bacterium HR29]